MRLTTARCSFYGIFNLFRDDSKGLKTSVERLNFRFPLMWARIFDDKCLQMHVEVGARSTVPGLSARITQSTPTCMRAVVIVVVVGVVVAVLIVVIGVGVVLVVVLVVV